MIHHSNSTPAERRLLLLVCAVAAVGLTLAAATRARCDDASRAPNIVMFLIDDLGWMDIGCQGNRRVDTPNIDRLAEQGVRFTDAYAAAPVCSPTRAAVLTGLAPARLRLTTHIPDRPQFARDDAPLVSAETLDHLPLEQVTIAERLRKAGYATAMLGKWHLAGDWRGGTQGRGELRFYPERQGFDLNLGGCAMGGPPTFFDPYRIHNLPPRRTGEYLPDRLAAEAIDFIRSHRQQPFLLMLWHYTVHWPMEAPQKLVEKYRGREGPNLKDARYAAMTEALDAAVGRVLAALDKEPIDRQTLVVFTSDNGAFMGVADNRPLRSGKGELYEGGIRVPLIVRAPNGARGAVCREPVVSMDLPATMMDAAGLQVDPTSRLDGESLMPLLTGDQASLGRQSLYFHYPNYAWHGGNRLGSAIRTGRWKLIERFDDNSVELFDLHADLSERTNLAAAHPDRAAAMRADLAGWRKSVNAAMPTRRQ